MNENDHKITIETKVLAPINKVWEYWTEPSHIVNWNAASDDWHTPHAENDLKVGGKFLSRMEARDGSFGFDFIGFYDEVVHHQNISYHMEDGRKVEVKFIDKGKETYIIEIFDPETENPRELQQEGWQMILNRFKTYTEQC
jgi:uncharacterized protein YndB with AHSA1/START domain